MRRLKKVFVKRHVSKKELRKLICSFAKQVGINKVVFNNKGIHVKGTYNYRNKNIYIDTQQTLAETLCTFFHELGHHTAVAKNKWSNYHLGLSPNMSMYQVFKIENKIDKIAKTLWYKYVDVTKWGKYKYAYPKAQMKILMEKLSVINND